MHFEIFSSPVYRIIRHALLSLKFSILWICWLLDAMHAAPCAPAVCLPPPSILDNFQARGIYISHWWKITQILCSQNLVRRKLKMPKMIFIVEKCFVEFHKVVWWHFEGEVLWQGCRDLYQILFGIHTPKIVKISRFLTQLFIKILVDVFGDTV